jgi:hypothetical protein
VLRFYADAWNRWDDRAVDELLTTDFTFRGSLRDHAHGRDEDKETALEAVARAPARG